MPSVWKLICSAIYQEKKSALIPFIKAFNFLDWISVAVVQEIQRLEVSIHQTGPGNFFFSDRNSEVMASQWLVMIFTFGSDKSIYFIFLLTHRLSKAWTSLLVSFFHVFINGNFFCSSLAPYF